MKKISILEIMDIQTGERSTLHTFDSVLEAPNWMPDGDTLLFNGDGRLYRYAISSGQVSAVDTGALAQCNNDHVVSHDGEAIGFSCYVKDGASSASQIFLMPARGGAARQVTRLEHSYLHGISLDGGELCYCAFRDQSVDVYAIPAAGGQERRLTDGKGYNDGPEYSPDDQHIWFNSTRCGLMQVFRMKRDGSELTQMTSAQSNAWFPHVSPDGRRVVYLTFNKDDLKPEQHLPDKQVSLWLMDEHGQGKRKLTDVFGGQGTINVNSWSPDSRRFAFVSYRYE